MKIFAAILVLISCSIIFYSCKSDDPVSTGPVQQGYTWEVLSTGISGNYDHLAYLDDNTALGITNEQAFRVTSTGASRVNLQDSFFNANNVAVYNPSYYAFAGVNYDLMSIRINLKIFDNGTITHATLDTHSSGQIYDMKILQPGKIAAISSSKLYIYDNGNVSAYTSPDSFSTGFKFIAVQGSALYITGYSKIYKFESGVLSAVDIGSAAGEFTRMKVDNAIIKAPFSSMLTVVSYWNGGSWIPLFTDASKKIFYLSAGESLSSIYFITVDSNFSYTSGKIWTGTQLMDDPNYPADIISTNYYTTAISNMRSNTIFIAKYNSTLYTGTIYRGRKNF